MDRWSVVMYDDEGNELCKFDAKGSKTYAYNAYIMFIETFRHVVMYYNDEIHLEYLWKEGS